MHSQSMHQLMHHHDGVPLLVSKSKLNKKKVARKEKKVRETPAEEPAAETEAEAKPEAAEETDRKSVV